MAWDNCWFWGWVVYMGVIIAVAAVKIYSFVYCNRRMSFRIGGHHDPVTGEFHGITHHFNRSPDLTWYADCAKCAADRDSSPVPVTEDDFPDLYASVRGVPSMVRPESGMKLDHEPQPPVCSVITAGTHPESLAAHDSDSGFHQSNEPQNPQGR